MRKILASLGIIVCVFVAIFLYSWYRVHESLLLPSIPNNESLTTYQVPYETRSFQTNDGKKLEGWYAPVQNPRAVIVVVHGYREVKGAVAMHGAYLYPAGYSTFFIDLRSDTPGAKATLGVEEYKDVEAAYDYMKSLPENKDKKIGFFGGSMGASTSIITTGKTGKGDFVIASVPYANYKSLLAARIKLEGLPSFLLPFVRLANAAELGWDYETYNPDQHIKNIAVPVFLISASKDTRVNGNDAKDLFDRANKPKYFWKANASHDVYKEQSTTYEKYMLDFLGSIH